MARYLTRTWPGNPTGQTRAERTPCRYRAYVPDELTTRGLHLTSAQVADVADVERRLVDLNAGSPVRLNLEALARLLLRAEAVASSFIEGLQVNVRRLAREEVAGEAGLETRDDTARAVLGNVRALESAVELADPARPITVEDIRALHARLLEGTRDAAYGGVLRAEQNWVGGTGMSPCTAAFVPPPPTEVERLMLDLVTYMSADTYPASVQAAIAHAQFETIHPFADGNGRTGRALIHVVLRRRGLAPRYVPPVSLILAAHADHYVAGLMAYRYAGSAAGHAARAGVAAWLDRFLVDMARACTAASDFAGRVEALEAGWRSSAAPVRSGSAVDLLLSALPAAPVLTVATAAHLIGRSVARTNDAVARLAACGVLRQTTIGRRNRAFEVPDLITAITGFERELASPAGDTRVAAPARPVPARPDGRGRAAQRR